MAMIATNVAVRSYLSDVGGDLAELSDWSTANTYYVGCNPNYNHNRVLVIRFTLEKPAKTVSITAKSASMNNTGTNKLLCYGMGGNPEDDDSMTNINGDDLAIGTFCFGGAYNTKTIELSYLAAGTHYLYIWGQNSSDYSLTSIEVYSTCNAGISYEELVGALFVGTGTGVVPYFLYVGSNGKWVPIIAYLGRLMI